jgi:hypothetical protein
MRSRAVAITWLAVLAGRWMLAITGRRLAMTSAR